MSGSVLVVGAGIAGLATARVLSAHGLRCTVMDRRRAGADGAGMGLNLPGNAMRCLGALDVADDVAALGIPLRRREYRNGSGRLLFAVDEEQFWGQVGQPVCVRHGHLVRVLETPNVAIQTAHVVAARPRPDFVEVSIAGERGRLRFDFVIGADGVHSAMRSAVTGDGTTPSAMTTAGWRFVGDSRGVDCWTAWSGREHTCVLIPVEEGRVYGYLARTRGGDTGTEPGWLADAASTFPRPVPDVVRSALADGHDIHHAAVDEARLPRWHNGRLVLIGDASHATGPVWAQGAAMALEDALVLGDLLARTPAPDWWRVGPEFERVRRPRVDHVQAATDRMSSLAARPGWLRDLGAPILGPRAYRAAYGPLRAPLSESCAAR